jgi:hypothetical protein
MMIETLTTYWMGIWKEPREAIRELLDRTSPSITCLLIALFGITLVVTQATTRNPLDMISGGAFFLIVMVVGPVVGGITWLILSLFIHGTSRLFGGMAMFKETVIGVTWATIPYISKWVLLLPMLLIFREELFTTATPVMDNSKLLSLLYVVFIVLNLVMTVFYNIIMSKVIGEINGFSAWKGFLSIILIPGVIFLLLMIRVILF